MTESLTFCERSYYGRAVIENVSPCVDGGRHPIKRIVDERTVVEADIFADGHDALAAVVKFRPENATGWIESPMEPLTNDRWRGEFVPKEPGLYCYTVEAWCDHFKSWRHDLEKKFHAGQNISDYLQVGAQIVEQAAQRADALDADQLMARARELRAGRSVTGGSVLQRALDDSLAQLMSRYPDRRDASTYEQELRIQVDPALARFSTWYEMFPRSCAEEPGRHGTFKDCEAQLPRIAGMGFDVLYFPPIHPIGRTFRKGRNNSMTFQPGDPGSPWAIGSGEGGHKAVHPKLGTLEDFRRLVRQAREQGIELALDIAFQCSPDHPYVKSHPGWFKSRPSGEIQCAENPPKKYEDIYPFDFECGDWEGLWRELKSVFDFWIEQGVRVFRVDNPHTKPFAFWEWCLNELKLQRPDLVFLAEAFTRPRVMQQLAKLGFTQSYNYFPWRNRKDELTEYFTELTEGPEAEYFRPNVWPNTPDILTEYLQHGGRPAFMIRLVLAATLSASYGIYGPAFEMCENLPREPGSEEYLNSEKYEIRHRDLKAPYSLQDLITRINRIRRENPALQSNQHLAFHALDNDQLLAYTKSDNDAKDTILTVVNLDPHHQHRGWLELPVGNFRLKPGEVYQMEDLLTGAHFFWKGARNYVELDPQFSPAHIFRLRHHVRTERDFDYYS
jgi:starch synthase (maltosyl-transferring)